eukprot:472178-Prymnesium_polylepis.1
MADTARFPHSDYTLGTGSPEWGVPIAVPPTCRYGDSIGPQQLYCPQVGPLQSPRPRFHAARAQRFPPALAL